MDPITVYDYPKDIKSFYMKQNENGDTVRIMDVPSMPEIGELIGVFREKKIMINY